MIYFLTQDDLNNMPRAKETDKVIILCTKKNVNISAEIFAKLIKGKFRGYEVITTSTKKEIEEIVAKKSKGKDFKIIGDSIKTPVATTKEVKNPAVSKKAAPKAAEKPAKAKAAASKTKASSTKKTETTKKTTKTTAKKTPAKKTTSKKK